MIKDGLRCVGSALLFVGGVSILMVPLNIEFELLVVGESLEQSRGVDWWICQIPLLMFCFGG